MPVDYPVDQESIAEEELEYEHLRSLCDLAITYQRLAEKAGMDVPRVSEAIGYLTELLNRISSDFGEIEILF